MENESFDFTHLRIPLAVFLAALVQISGIVWMISSLSNTVGEVTKELARIETSFERRGDNFEPRIRALEVSTALLLRQCNELSKH